MMSPSAQCLVATKLPCWLVETPKDFDRFLNEQLERLQTDHIDVYLLHRLNTLEQSWPRMRDLGVSIKKLA
jgi:predicted aldo/keto reductase-like oxidoreductase